MLSSHWLGVLLTVPTPPAEMPRFTCEFRKKEDTFQVVAPKPGAETFRIRSVSGIGNGTITCRERAWPETITILFAGMKYLESFGMEGNGVALSGNLQRDKNPSVWFFNERGDALADEKGSVYRLTIEHLKDEGIRVTLATPPAARKAKSWSINWLDAFRR